MKAKQLVEELGESLVGRRVMTEPFGDWPGGEAEVIALMPDPAAPEIVFQVYSKEHGTIGVFEYEKVSVLP